jgi:hypothetical protein
MIRTVCMNRRQHRQLAQPPQGECADRQIDERQPRHLVARHQHHAQTEGAAHAEHDAHRRQQEVLELEIAQDLAARGAHRAARTDHARALLHPEAGQADDAEGGDHHQRDDHATHQPDHGTVLRVVGSAHLGQGLDVVDDARAVDLADGFRGGLDGGVALRRLHPHQVGAQSVARIDRMQDRVAVVDIFTARVGVREPLDNADHRRRFLTECIHRLPDRRAAGVELRCKIAADDHLADLGVLLRLDLRCEEVLLRPEVAPLDQLQAEREHRLFAGGVRRHRRARRIPVGLGAGTAGVAVVAEDDLAGDGDALDAGQRAQRLQVLPGDAVRVTAGGGAAHLQHHQLVLGQAGVELQRGQALADQVQRVADDRGGQRNLQHDQDGRGLVAAQGREDGQQVHGHRSCIQALIC